MTCGCAMPFPAPFRLHVPNTFPDDVAIDAIAPRAFPDGYEAVAVGPESDFADYFLFPEGGRVENASTPLLVTGQLARQAAQANAIKVGVRTPYYGLLSGPIRLASHMSQLTGAGNVAGARRSLTGVASAYKGTVDLLFYPKRPPNMPLMRPDKRHVGRWTFGTADNVETTILTAPGYGWREQLFSVRRVSGSVAYSSGNIELRFYGHTFMGRFSSVDYFASTQLGSTTTISSNDFTRTYEFEGRYDYYTASVEENSLVGPDGILEIQALLRDC